MCDNKFDTIEPVYQITKSQLCELRKKLFSYSDMVLGECMIEEYAAFTLFCEALNADHEEF